MTINAFRSLAAACVLCACAMFATFAAARGNYLEALAACRAAAEATDDPTEFDCDWKTVVGGAPGSALTGKFKYKEKGLAGEMTILESSDGPALVGISTVSNDPNAHTCSVTLAATRVDDQLVAKPEDAEGCEVRIASVKGPNLVSVTATNECSTYCGMRAIFAGTWQLTNK